MFFTIDASNGMAIYEQIVRQVKYAIAEEALRPGQLLPSARTMSLDLAINPNTVVRAFQQLQSEGVLESLRGRGLAVRAEALTLCKSMRSELIEQKLSDAIREALQAGLGVDEIANLVSRLLEQLGPQVSPAGQADASSKVASNEQNTEPEGA